MNVRVPEFRKLKFLKCQLFSRAVACIIKIRRRTYDASVVLFTIMKVLQRRKYDAGVVTLYFWLKKYDASIVIYDANVVNYDRIGFYNTGHRFKVDLFSAHHRSTFVMNSRVQRALN